MRSAVNLRTASEQQGLSPEEERKLAEDAGLAHLHHPVAGNQLPDEVVASFRQKLTDLPAPVVVDCASGTRAGAMAMMYLRAEQKPGGEETMEKARSLGLKPGSPELDEFIRTDTDRRR